MSLLGGYNSNLFGFEFEKYSDATGLHPVDFLNQFENDNRFSLLTDADKISAINRFLEGHAKLWAQCVLNSCKTYSEYKHKFLDYFWSNERQHDCKESVIFGEKYDSRDGSQEDFILKCLSKCRHLGMPFYEIELVHYIADRLPPQTKLTFITNKVKSINDALDTVKILDNRNRDQSQHHGRNSVRKGNHRDYEKNEELFRLDAAESEIQNLKQKLHQAEVDKNMMQDLTSQQEKNIHKLQQQLESEQKQRQVLEEQVKSFKTKLEVMKNQYLCEQSSVCNLQNSLSKKESELSNVKRNLKESEQKFCAAKQELKVFEENVRMLQESKKQLEKRLEHELNEYKMKVDLKQLESMLLREELSNSNRKFRDMKEEFETVARDKQQLQKKLEEEISINEIKQKEMDIMHKELKQNKNHIAILQQKVEEDARKNKMFEEQCKDIQLMLDAKTKREVIIQSEIESFKKCVCKLQEEVDILTEEKLNKEGQIKQLINIAELAEKKSIDLEKLCDQFKNQQEECMKTIMSQEEEIEKLHSEKLLLEKKCDEQKSELQYLSTLYQEEKHLRLEADKRLEVLEEKLVGLVQEEVLEEDYIHETEKCIPDHEDVNTEVRELIQDRNSVGNINLPDVVMNTVILTSGIIVTREANRDSKQDGNIIVPYEKFDNYKKLDNTWRAIKSANKLKTIIDIKDLPVNDVTYLLVKEHNSDDMQGFKELKVRKNHWNLLKQFFLNKLWCCLIIICTMLITNSFWKWITFKEKDFEREFEKIIFRKKKWKQRIKDEWKFIGLKLCDSLISEKWRNVKVRLKKMSDRMVISWIYLVDNRKTNKVKNFFLWNFKTRFKCLYCLCFGNRICVLDKVMTWIVKQSSFMILYREIVQGIWYLLNILQVRKGVKCKCLVEWWLYKVKFKIYGSRSKLPNLCKDTIFCSGVVKGLKCYCTGEGEELVVRLESSLR